jgi:predicted esterase
MSDEQHGAETHALTVQRTARYHTLGPPSEEARAVWVVLHGYGQRAAAFAEHFALVAEAGGCVVAPEALSRFYTEGGSGAVGASWMTRADREAEIADYLAYLDALAARLFEVTSAPLHVLGFSQGTATAARWAAHRQSQGRPVERLTLWAGGLPPELSPDAIAPTRLTLVVGERDAYVTPERLADERQRLDAAGADYDLLRFDGGHRLDDDTLRGLVDA